MTLTARGTRGGSATGVGLVVVPRRLTAFAMRLAAETRDERVRAAGAVAGMAAPSEVGVTKEVGLARRAA